MSALKVNEQIGQHHGGVIGVKRRARTSLSHSKPPGTFHGEQQSMMMMLVVVIRTEVRTQRCGAVMIKSREAMHRVGTRHTAHVFKVCKMSLSGIRLPI